MRALSRGLMGIGVAMGIVAALADARLTKIAATALAGACFALAVVVELAAGACLG